MLNPINIELISTLVKSVAEQELLPRFAKIQSQQKVDGSLISEADLMAQEQLAKRLLEHWPDIPLLSEEQSRSEQKNILATIGKYAWCIDPLDGTSNFIAGIPYYALSLALIDASSVLLSVIYDPSRKECFTAVRGKGSWLNGKRINPPPQTANLSDAIGLIDLKRLPENLKNALIFQPPYKSQRSFGAVALDWCWLATNRVQIYLHGSQNIWDYAGGYLVFTEAGGCASTLKGNEVYLCELKKRSAVASINEQLQTDWFKWVSENS